MMNDPMSSLSRTSSAASFSSDDINIITPSAINASRRTRKRFTNSQLTMLENLFHRTSHPSREEREAVAKAGQMEIKSVTIWFQNKRQTERKSAANKEATSRTASPVFGATSSTSSSGTKSLLSVGGRPSLDKIATRTEMRNHHGARTPSRRHTTSGPGEHIWDHMPSSPLVPPSPATSDYVDYPKNARSKRTLEWACAAARASDRDHQRQPLHQSHSYSHPSSSYSHSVSASSHHARRTVHRERPIVNTHPDVTPKGAPIDLELTEDEEEEAVTPPNTMMADDPRWYDARERHAHELPSRKPLPTDDDDMMKAALALCGLGAGTRR